jgi:hypothetical protein
MLVQNIRQATSDPNGSFCAKRVDRNWLGMELGHAEDRVYAGADYDVARQIIQCAGSTTLLGGFLVVAK